MPADNKSKNKTGLNIFLYTVLHVYFRLWAFNLITGGVGHLFRANVINQASSDSQLAKNRTKFSDSLNDMDWEPGNDRDGPAKDNRGPIFLPNVANMKHNVSEKVAQVK